MPRLARHNSHSPGQVWQPAQGRRMLQQSHRIYDENTVCRLRRILLLRKLRISGRLRFSCKIPVPPQPWRFFRKTSMN